MACGALGSYDRGLVAAIAGHLDGDLNVVHEDESSILATDREPIRWQGERSRGYAWSERVESIDGSHMREWGDAATAGSACGLVVEGRRRYVHSSVAGVAAVYYLRHGRAVYFATTVDALALTSPRRLAVDWEAWASILTLDLAIGDRTPFADIRLLLPFSTLESRRGRPRVQEARWPWAEVEPTLDVEAGADAALEAMRASISRVPDEPIVCHLSGGLDSRLCLALLCEERVEDLSALTVDPDKGTDLELGLAAGVASKMGVPHRVVSGSSADWWADLKLRSLRVDFQYPRSPWRMPMLPALRGGVATSVDGFGFDFHAGPNPRFFPFDTVDERDESLLPVFEALQRRHKRRTPWMLEPRLRETLWASSREQYLTDSKRFRGHPSRSVLTYWRMRQARAHSMTPYATLGADVPIAMPFADDAVARACLAITFESKRGGSLYEALFDRIDPGLGRMPSTSRRDAPPGAPIPRRNRSAEIAESILEAVESGPLAPWIKPRAMQRLTRHHRGRDPRADRAAIGVMTFHGWCDRYRQVLGEVDVEDGVGVAPPLDTKEARRT